MQGKPSITIYLDSRRPLKSGLYPVKLCVTFRIREARKARWVRKYYSLAEASEADFASLDRPRSNEQKRLSSIVSRERRKAEDILERHPVMSASLFDRLFTGSSGGGVLGMFERYVAELRELGQVSTASSYATAMRSLRDFAGGDFSFQEISLDWLRRYEKWMRGHKVKKLVGGKEKEVTVSASITTISMYLRTLRKIYNDAIAERIISADLYPFGRRQFVIQSVVKPKQALSVEQKDQVLAYDGPHREVVDFWIFSYLCNGINFSDIARLRRRDIQADGKDSWILLDRTKTRRTSRVLKKVEILLGNQAKAIIARRGLKTLSPEEYVFGVLRPGMTPQQERDRILDFIDRTNKGLREVAKELGFPFRFTTYTARHTFANISMIKGATKAQIQEALGHANIRTTEVYAGSFDRESKRKMSERL